MDSEKTNSPDDGRVVYRRFDASGEMAGHGTGQGDGGPPRAGWRQLAPTLWPLLAGFIFLLLLVLLLGILSERELDNVKSGVANRQASLGFKTDLLARTKDAAERLNNEARTRAEHKAHNELQPPVPVNLWNARKALLDELANLDGPAVKQLPNWLKLRDDLRVFADTARDADQYDARGFVEFRTIREDFAAVQTELQAETRQVDADGEQLREHAVRRVRLLWLTALILGVLVVAGTVAEVQKRFLQVNRSVESARRERRFSTQILEGMVSAVAAVDARGRIRSANGAFMEVFPGAKVGVSVHSELPASGSLKSLEAAIAQPVKEATYFGRFQISVAAKSPAERTFDVYSSPLEIEGEQGRIVTLMDVTDAVEAETVARRTEALAAVGEASAQLAHEIKNPLGSIRLGVSILRDMTERPDALRTIDLVERGIEHLNKLVVDVTHYSRQRPLALAPVKLEDLLDVSLMLVEDRVQEKNIKVTRDFGEPVVGRWDDDQLTQVFVNLLANGIDASPEGANLTVTVRLIAESNLSPPAHREGSAAQRGFVRVVIEDEGSGMEAATVARIFEPFYTTKKRGTGLGLSVVKQIVEQHGGGIAVESDAGTGTRFIVELPLTSLGATGVASDSSVILEQTDAQADAQTTDQAADSDAKA